METQQHQQMIEWQSETERFLGHARTVVEHHLDDPAFSTEVICPAHVPQPDPTLSQTKGPDGYGPQCLRPAPQAGKGSPLPRAQGRQHFQDCLSGWL